MSVLCIPAECDNIKLPIEYEIASHWDANLLCDICRHFASVMLHFASLISHNLRCIPAYTHQIPTEFHHKSSLGQLVYQFQKIRCVRFRNSKCSEHIDGKVIIGGTFFASSYFLKFKEMGGNTNKFKESGGNPLFCYEFVLHL